MVFLFWKKVKGTNAAYFDINFKNNRNYPAFHIRNNIADHRSSSTDSCEILWVSGKAAWFLGVVEVTATYVENQIQMDIRLFGKSLINKK